MRLKIDYIKKSMLTIGIIGMMLLVFDSNTMVQAASPKLKIESRDRTSRKVEMVVTAKDINWVSILDFYYNDNNGKSKDLKTACINITAYDGKVVLSYICRKKRPGTYHVLIQVDWDNGHKISTLNGKFTYSTEKRKEEKSVSESPTMRLESDGTKPVVKIASKYSKGKTKYFNEDVYVPITINEKNFEQRKTTVMVNGKAVSPLWSGSGTIHQAKVKLKEGKNVIEASTVDKSGNKSDIVKSGIIIIDKKNPKVKIEGFENGRGKGLQNGEVVSLPLKITVFDETKIGKLKVELYQFTNDGKTKTKIDLHKNTISYNKIEYNVDDLKEDGYYYLNILVEDKAGNKPDKKGVKSEGKRAYNVSKGIITGAFTVNRAGSMYVVENAEIFNKQAKKLNDIVIYEYNKNEIISQKVEIIDSIRRRELIPKEDYGFKALSKSDRAEYKYKYEYIIYADNFDEGYYNIQISSISVAGKNGTLISQTKDSSNLNKTIILDKTPPKIILFEGTTGGKIKLKIRDDNMDESSVRIVIGGKQYTLRKNEKDSTSTNIIFEGKINRNPEGAKVCCKDLAGNEINGGEIVIAKYSILKSALIYCGLALGGLILIIGSIAAIVIINNKKK